MNLTNYDYTSPGTTRGDVDVPIPSAKTMDIAVNAAFFQEIKEDNVRLKQLLHDVKSSLDGASFVRRQMRKLSEQLGELRDQLAMHFALEEAFGYFNDAVMVAPELSRLAESLRGEHMMLYAQIGDIADQAEELAYHATPHRRCHNVLARTRAFCDQLHQHECRENELILRAYDDDVGVGD